MHRFLVVLVLCAPLFAADALFVATPFTASHSFTEKIEGPACDRAGNVYAVSFARTPTIGRVTPDGHGEALFSTAGTPVALAPVWWLRMMVMRGAAGR